MVELSQKTTDREADQFETYQAISPWAPTAMLLGIASVMAIIHPLLWFVPFLGVIFGCLGLRQLASHTGQIGRKGILCGLALSLFFGTLAPARIITRSWLLTRESRRISIEWLELVSQGNLEQAHQWTLEAVRRHRSELPIKQYYEQNANVWKDLQEFFQSEETQEIVKVVQKGKVRYDTRLSMQPDRNSVHIAHQFVVDDIERKHEMRLNTFLKRTIDRQTGKAYWQIEAFHEDRS